MLVPFRPRRLGGKRSIRESGGADRLTEGEGNTAKELRRSEARKILQETVLISPENEEHTYLYGD